jgi:hypothetical protein
MKRAAISIPFALVIACLSAGCAKSSSKAEGVVPASGVVTLDGASVAGATVTFYPDGGAGKAAAGSTDAQGKFQLTTLNANDGAKPGTYKVMVSKIETTGPGATMSQEEQYKYLEQHGSPPPTESKNVLPEQFAEVTTTTLTATVSESGPNDFKFDLRGAPSGTPAAGMPASGG